jgi:hypothetical protein
VPTCPTVPAPATSSCPVLARAEHRAPEPALLHYPMPGWPGDCLRSYAIPGTQQAQRQPASRLQKQHGWLIWLVRMNHPFLQSAFCMC